MSRIAARIEVQRLAEVLGLGNRLPEGVESLPAEELKRLRERINELVFDDDSPAVRRLARLAVFLPDRLTAWLARRWIGPWLTARIASAMPARRAAAVACALPAEFLAAVAVELDPRRARDLLRRLPVATILGVAGFLLDRCEYAALGRFVEYVDDAAIRAVIDTTPAEADLLKVAYHVSSRNRLDHLVRMLPQARRAQAMLLVLDESQDILLELLALIVHVGYGLQRELGDLVAAQDEAVLDRIIEATHHLGLWPDLLPVVAMLSQTLQARVVNLPRLREQPDILEQILAVVDEHRLWTSLLPLVRLMQAPMREALARAAAGLEDAAMRRACDAAQLTERWDEIADVVALMPRQHQRRILDLAFDYVEPDTALGRRLLDLVEARALGPALRVSWRRSLASAAPPAAG